MQVFFKIPPTTTPKVIVGALQSKQTQAKRPYKGEFMGIFNGIKFELGNMEIISGSGGFNATVQHLWNFDFYSDNRGNHGTVSHFGNIDHFNFNNGNSGTIMHFGGRKKHS
jgi:hypothetical protein